MRAWYFDNLPGDERLLHDSGRSVSLEHIQSLNVLYWNVPIDKEGEWKKNLDEVASKNDFPEKDWIALTKEGLGDSYADTLKEFYDEHLHEDDEIRFVVTGAGFYDVREHPTDEWIRMHLSAGDLIAIPKGIYHRFMLDEQNQISGYTLWKATPNWTPLPRGQDTDSNPSRSAYLKSLTKMDENGVTDVGM